MIKWLWLNYKLINTTQVYGRSLEAAQTGCYWESLDPSETNWKIPTSMKNFVKKKKKKKESCEYLKYWFLQRIFFLRFKPSYVYIVHCQKKKWRKNKIIIIINVPVEVKQLVKVEVPLKGQLCTLSTFEHWYFRVVICTLELRYYNILLLRGE